MPPTTADELALINDSEFLQELEQFERNPDPIRSAGRSGADPRPADPDGFAALDSGLPIEAGSFQDLAPFDDLGPVDDPSDADVSTRRRTPPAQRVSFVTAAFVLVACLSAGAAAAAYVFHARLEQVSAVRSASR